VWDRGSWGWDRGVGRVHKSCMAVSELGFEKPSVGDGWTFCLVLSIKRLETVLQPMWSLSSALKAARLTLMLEQINIDIT